LKYLQLQSQWENAAIKIAHCTCTLAVIDYIALNGVMAYVDSIYSWEQVRND